MNWKSPGLWISVGGLGALALMYAVWLADNPDAGLAGNLAALASLALFALLCLRFVPRWMDFWRPHEPPEAEAEPERPGMDARIFLALIASALMMLLMVHVLRRLLGYGGGFAGSLQFWTCLDSAHYLDIARDWYLSEGSVDRLVQLVFLPGYPLAVRLFSVFTGSYLYAAFLVSILSFALSGCVFYRLLRLDFSNAQALRCLKYLCIMPASFFFAAPMSESLFLLLCLLCLYLARRGRYFTGCVFGALAAFTRSLGLMLFAPLFFELMHELAQKRLSRGRAAAGLASLLLIPLGFGAYCLINYFVSGDPFKFMEYQSGHWGQQLGFFFNTASYQFKNALSSASSSLPYFLGLWLPNLLSIFGSLVLAACCADRLRPSYTAWFIAYFVVAVGATWLLSAPRYMAAMPVVPMAPALCTRGRRDGLLSALCLLLNFMYMCAFVLRWQVW